MAIQNCHGDYVVTVKGHYRDTAMQIDVATSAEQARELEAAMIAECQKSGRWPSDEPAQGTLAAVLAATWKDPAHGWHKMRGGHGLYATARHFVVALGAERLVETIDAETLEAYLKARHKEERHAIIRAVYHLLRCAWRLGWLPYRPVRLAPQRGCGLPYRIALRWTPPNSAAPNKRQRSPQRKETSFVRLHDGRGRGPMWQKVEA